MVINLPHSILPVNLVVDTKLIETGRGNVTADLCDRMGHFTTRHYTAAFDDASYKLAEACGLIPDQETGFADLELNMKFISEIREGDCYYIKSGFVKLGNSSFVAMHHLINDKDDSLVASCEEKAVIFDLIKRKSKPMSDEFRSLAGKFLVD